MLLQELFKEKNKGLSKAYSVVLDEKSSDPEYSTPPENLKEIGFVLKIDEEGMMDEALLDVVISYRLTNLPVLIEVPTQLISKGSIEVKYLMQLANNVDFSIALLPPGHPLVGDEISINEYKDVILKMLDELLNKPNFDKFIYPISNFFEYLMLEQILGKEKLVNFKPEDEYIKDNFLNVMTTQDSNLFKDAIRGRLYDFYGGEQEFNLVAKTIIGSVYEKSVSMYKDAIIQAVKNNSEQFETSQQQE